MSSKPKCVVRLRKRDTTQQVTTSNSIIQPSAPTNMINSCTVSSTCSSNNLDKKRTPSKSNTVIHSSLKDDKKLVTDDVVLNIANKLNINLDTLSTPEPPKLNNTIHTEKRTTSTLGNCFQSANKNTNSFNCISNGTQTCTNAQFSFTNLDQSETLDLKKKLEKMKQYDFLKGINKFDEYLDGQQNLSCVEETEAINVGASEVTGSNKNIKVYSADESVVEVSKDCFEPNFVSEINYEILKLPNSMQKNHLNDSPNNVRDSAFKKPVSKFSVGKKPSSSARERRFRPRSLDEHMKSVSSSRDELDVDSKRCSNIVSLCPDSSKSCNELSKMDLVNELSSARNEQLPKQATSLPHLTSSSSKSSSDNQMSSVNNVQQSSAKSQDLKANKVTKGTLESLKSLSGQKSNRSGETPLKNCKLNSKGDKYRKSRQTAVGTESSTDKSVVSSSTSVSENNIKNVCVRGKTYQILNKIGSGGSSIVSIPLHAYDLVQNNLLMLLSGLSSLQCRNESDVCFENCWSGQRRIVYFGWLQKWNRFAATFA